MKETIYKIADILTVAIPIIFLVIGIIFAFIISWIAGILVFLLVLFCLSIAYVNLVDIGPRS